MKPKKRQKLCYNCEGEVDLDVIVCPFCAADLREEKPELQKSSFSPSTASVKQLNTEQSLYPLSYSRIAEPEKIVHSSEPIAASMLQEEVEEQPKTMQTALMALAPLILGIHLFLWGVLLVLFSDRGTMILKWDARFWFAYVLASIPLLLFGYRGFNKF